MKKTTILLLALSSLSLQSALAQDAKQLFQSKVCAACHSMDMKMVGPAVKDIAKKYADQEGAVEVLAKSIKNGSKDKWGPMAMPPNNVTEEEAKALAEWVLKQGS